MSNLPTPTLLDQIIAKGLSKSEAELALRWTLPINPLHFEVHSHLFVKGHSCHQIQEIMRDHPIEALQAARAQLDWDKKRSEYRESVMSYAIDNMKADFAGGLRYLGDYLNATHAEFQKALINKAVNPEREKMPSIGKNDMDSYLNTMKFLRDTLQPKTPGGGHGPNGTNPNAGSLVSINIVGAQPGSIIESSASKPIDITPDRAAEIKKARAIAAGRKPDEPK